MKALRQPAASAADGVDRALANLFAIVADRGAEPPPTGEWGGHEVLAHLVFWHEHYVRLLRSQLDGITPALPGGTFKELNAAAVRRFQTATTEELERRLWSAERDLAALAADPRLAGAHLQLKAGSKPWPWPDLLPRIEGHVRGHARALRRRRGRIRASGEGTSRRPPNGT